MLVSKKQSIVLDNESTQGLLRGIYLENLPHQF